MTKKRFFGLLLSCAAAWFLGNPTLAHAADQKFQAQLIWGVDEKPVTGKDLKPLEGEAKEKLQKIFKWKQYFEVNKQNMAVPAQGTQKVKLSDKCEVEIQSLGNSTIELKLYGEGKCVKKLKKPVMRGDLIVLAGDDKNDTAWFVIVTPQ